MQFTVCSALGMELFHGEMDDDTRVDVLKGVIYRKWNIPVEEQRIIFRERQLDNCHTLSDYGVYDSAILILISRLGGG